MMLKVLLVFGTRPEAIKMCPLILEFRKKKSVKCVVCLTGQHKEMLQQVMDVFDVREDYNLDIMEQHQSLSSITMKIIGRFDEIVKKEQPDIVLVHGDTTTSFAAALSAFYARIPVGHVEAGLRTYNMVAPYPEEFNRQAVDMVSSLYFAPTKEARRNLLREGKEKKTVYVTGNTVIDAFKYTVTKDYRDENLEWAGNSKLILITTHRRENIGEPMKNIFRALRRIVEENDVVKVIFPVHRNPKIRKIAVEYLCGRDRIKMIEPLDVLAFHNLMARSCLILTDSGGIQEEAPSFGIPVLILRDVTERLEGVKAGCTKLIGTDEDEIYHSVCRLLNNQKEYQKMCHSTNPYGDGKASEKIMEILLKQEWRV